MFNRKAIYALVAAVALTGCTKKPDPEVHVHIGPGSTSSVVIRGVDCEALANEIAELKILAAQQQVHLEVQCE